MLSVTTSSAVVNLNPVGSNAGIVYLSYSVVVVTQNNSYVDLVTTVTNNLIDYSEFTNYFMVTSKFVFGQGTHQVNNFIQWMTTPGGTCGSGQWYWIMLNVETISGTSQVKVPYYQDNDVLNVKMNVLIVAKQLGSQNATFYSTYSQLGDFTYGTISNYSPYFTYNLGINTTDFGESTSGQRCLHGLTYLFLDCNRGYSSRTNSGLFTISGTMVTGVTSSRAEILRI